MLLTWKFYLHGNFTYMERSVECLIAQGNLNIIVRRSINHHPDLEPDPQLTWVHNILRYRESTLRLDNSSQLTNPR